MRSHHLDQLYAQIKQQKGRSDVLFNVKSRTHACPSKQTKYKLPRGSPHPAILNTASKKPRPSDRGFSVFTHKPFRIYILDATHLESKFCNE